MTDVEAFGHGPQGGLYNFFAELPDTIDPEQIGITYMELDANVRGIKEPPVASIEPGLSSESDDIDDARKFYVHFETQATEDDVIAAVRIVTAAISKLRS